jgi:hypothetical protein
VGLLEQENGAFGQFGEFTARGAAAWLVGESGGSALVEAFLPGIEGVLGESDQGGEVAGGQSGAAPGIEDEESLLWGESFGVFLEGAAFAGVAEATSLRKNKAQRGDCKCCVGRVKNI